ncbi:MAG: OB-fold nucleic acid binding domain-containing protein [Candidatus Bathyarchaeota archaeon]|nr:OB-fold nucleic acid binding domain-containing protein [Candidatus Bathyarchaeota archaeon]
MIEEKERDAKGFLTRESAARAVAAELGVQSSEVYFERRVSIKDLVSGLGDVTVTGRVILVGRQRKFVRSDGEKGRLRRLFVVDGTGEMKVVLWNDKANMPNMEKLTDRIVRFSHGYVRRGFDGGNELNIGSRGGLEIAPPNVSEDEFPPLTSFFKKIGEITGKENSVDVLGTVERIYPVSTFKRKDGSEGKVRRLELKDDSGGITVVLWNRKADELCEIEGGRYLEILRAKVKESANGYLELHVNFSADAAVLPKT